MRTLALIGLLFLTYQSLAQRPNIILIIADDISQDDIGCYGNKAVRTPNIDRLASSGIKFNNAFVTSSSCSPSRASIITGRYPHNTGAAELHTPLPSHLNFFPEALKNSGYYTAQAGKWHEGPHTKRAYDTLIAGDVNGAGGEDQWINLLQKRPKDKPFFFWFAPYDAHRDWQTDTNFSAKNTKVVVPPALVNDEATRNDLAQYYYEISRLDQYIGKLEQELKSQKINDNTIIIFMADNGRPFPGSKTRLYDGGVKTPFIVKWPKGIPKNGVQCESLISSIDIAPTLLMLADTSIPETVQGKSFDALLKSPTQPFRNYVFTEHNWHDYEAYERGVRSKDFLYVLNLRPQLANQGPLDAVNSPSFKSLLNKQSKQKLSPAQADLFIQPRAQEEFFYILDGKSNEVVESQLTVDKGKDEIIRRHREILKQWQEETADTQPEQLTKDWYDRVNGQPTTHKDKRGEMPGASKNADKVNAKGPF